MDTEIHCFPFPDDHGAEAVVLAYRRSSGSYFLTANKHVGVGGKEKQVPVSEETEADAEFLKSCMERVAETLREAGERVEKL